MAFCFFNTLNSLPNDKCLDWSKLKEFADDNVKFDENGWKFSKQVENNVGKGKLLVMSNFSFFHEFSNKRAMMAYWLILGNLFKT